MSALLLQAVPPQPVAYQTASPLLDGASYASPERVLTVVTMILWCLIVPLDVTLSLLAA
jgi:hypothetical protein